MRVQICIDLIRFVLINLISKNFLYGCLLFQQSNFLLKIILRIAAVYLHIKRKFAHKHLILEMIKHKCHRTSEYRQSKQCRQCSHGKPQCPDLRRKLPEQKQRIPTVNSRSLFSDITGDPRRNACVKKINRQHQSNKKSDYNSGIPCFKTKQKHTEYDEKQHR